MTTPMIACMFCERLRVSESQKCDAFPEGIPDEIWSGDNGHSKPYPGDNGLQFKAKEREK